jgi:hypothetical protein
MKAAEAEKPMFKRIMLKLSGEALMGEQNYGIDTKVAEAVAQEIKDVTRSGLKLQLWSAAETSFAAFPKARAIWTGRARIISECWQPYERCRSSRRARKTQCLYPRDVGDRHTAACLNPLSVVALFDILKKSAS